MTGNNKIICNTDIDELNNLTIRFEGNHNILYIDKEVKFANSSITFSGDNSLVYLSTSNHPYKISITVNNSNTVFIGSHCYFNQLLHIIASEYQNVIIGAQCLLSFGIWLRTADPHLIYDVATRQRINPSQSIYIGDHIWIGQESLILKGTVIGTGAIVGGHSVVSGKRIPSNTIWGGNPVRLIREHVVFDSKCVHKWTPEDTKRFWTYDSSVFLCQHYKDNTTIDIDKLDVELKNFCSADDRLKFVGNHLTNISSNRFFIPMSNRIKLLRKRK